MKDLYSLDKPAGHLFYGTHTTFGFSSALNEKMKLLEGDMRVDHFFAGFMVGLDMDISSNNSSVADQYLDMCLKIVLLNTGTNSGTTVIYSNHTHAKVLSSQISFL